MASGWAEQPASGTRGRVAFWIGTDLNGVFDEQTLRYIADRAGMVILNAPLQGPSSTYDYPTIVQRLHELRPGLPVLFYTWASRWHDGVRIGTTTLDGYPNLGPLLLHDAQGKVIQQRNGKLLFGDVRQEVYRNWLVERVQDMILKTGVDGVAVDVAVRTPTLMLASLCKRDVKFCADYAHGMDILLAALRTRLRPKIVLYNGLWSLAPGMLEDQQKLLDHADATAIEYFGMHTKQGIPPFEEGILPYLKIIQANPDKTILVFGRGPWRYTNYWEDYLWQRYLYCSYLLAAGPNTLFKYHASFQVLLLAGRSGGLDTYEDWQEDLGAALGPYHQDGGLYWRRFTKGLVLVAPHDGQGKSYSLTDTMYTPEGERLEGTITIAAGQGLLLHAKAPEVEKPIWLDFESSQPPEASWRWAEIRTEGGSGHFLHLDRTPKAQEWEHDLMLEPLRVLHPKPILRMRLRTTDPNAKLLFMLEVDDRDQKDTYIVIEGAPSAKHGQGITMGPGMSFRSNRGRGKATRVPAEVTFRADGKWYPITIHGDQLLDGTKRYVFRRWGYMRIIGNVDIDDINMRQ
jgi:hypothetical protein